MKTAMMVAAAAIAIPGAATPAPAQMATPTPAPTPAPASAPAAPGTLASATRLVTLMKMQAVLDRMFEQLTPLMVANVIGAIERAPGAPADIKLRVADTTTRQRAGAILGEEVMASFRKRYPEIFTAAAKQYAATFSEADLQTAIAFYQSATGQRLIDAQPQLQATLSEQGRVIGMAAGAEAVPAAIKRIAALPAPGTK